MPARLLVPLLLVALALGACRNSTSDPSNPGLTRLPSVDSIKAAAALEVFKDMFTNYPEQTLYVEPTPCLPATLAQVGACKVEFVTREAFIERFKDRTARNRPLSVQVGVADEKGGPPNVFHVVIFYSGSLGIGGHRDCTFRIENGKAVFVKKDEVTQ